MQLFSCSSNIIIGSPTPQFDFTSSSATLTFAVGSGPFTTQSFSVPVVNDSKVENMENIPLQATVVGGAAVGTFTAGRDTADINIIDDDGKCVILLVNFQLL